MVQGAHRDMRPCCHCLKSAAGSAGNSAFFHEPAEPVFSLDDIRPDKYNDFRLLQTFPMTLEEFSQKRDIS